MSTSTAPKNKLKNQPEITPHEVIKELPLEKVIDNKLAENNVTKKVLNAMKNKYMTDASIGLVLKDDFVLKNPTDKETYLRIKDERKAVRKIGILTEDLCKKGRADAISIQKLWLGKEKEILDEVAIVQNPLDEQIKIFEDEEKRLAALEEERKDAQYNIRQAELIKMGAVFANGCMNINELAIEVSNIREADDEIYNETILPLFRLQYEKNEHARIEEENKKKREREEFEQKQQQMKQQQEEFEKQQREFQQQQEQFKEQQEQLRQQKIKNRCMQLEALGMKFSFQADAYTFGNVNVDNKTEVCLLDDAAWETLLQKIKPAIEQIKADAVIKEERKSKRAAQLSSLGMTFTGSHYVFDDVQIPATDITGLDDNNWSQLIATTEPIIGDRKEKAEKKEIGNRRMATLKMFGEVKQTEVELSELSEADFTATLDNYKNEAAAATVKQLQKQQEEDREFARKQQEEDAAKASDKEKWTSLITTISSIVMPEFKSPIYKGKAAQLVSKINEIKSI